MAWSRRPIQVACVGGPILDEPMVVGKDTMVAKEAPWLVLAREQGQMEEEDHLVGPTGVGIRMEVVVHRVFHRKVVHVLPRACRCPSWSIGLPNAFSGRP